MFTFVEEEIEQPTQCYFLYFSPRDQVDSGDIKDEEEVQQTETLSIENY